jgi:hypothetical protein
MLANGRRLARRGAEHHGDDEEDEEDAHDERERCDITRLCRLHDAHPQLLIEPEFPTGSLPA